MTTNAISFGRAYTTSNQIRFGVDQIIHVSVAATLKKPVPSFVVAHVQQATITATLRKPVPAFSGVYDNNVWRGIDVSVLSLFSETQKQDTQNMSSFGSTTKCDQVNLSEFRDCLGVATETRIDFTFTKPTDKQTSSKWQDGLAINKELSSQYKEMLRVDKQTADGWKEGLKTDQELLSSWHEMLRVDKQTSSTFRDAKKTNKDYDWSFNEAKKLNKSFETSYQFAKVRPAFSWHRIEIITPPITKPIDNSIVFLRPYKLENRIVFEHFQETPTIKYILSKRLYYMLNTIDCVRVSDNKRIQISSITCSTSQDDWGWKISGNIVGKASYDALRETAYTELLMTINNYQFRCFITDLKESRTFGKGNYSLSGVGRSFELSTPFSKSQSKSFSADRNVSQLLSDELTDTGWSLTTSEMNDWLVAANSYAYANMTPIAAISDIAKNSANFVDSDRVQKIINVKKRYPVLPWNLSSATPDFVMPLNPIRELSREFVVAPNYNAVYVSGASNTGILAKVKITGTDGLEFADTIQQNPLITNDTAARITGSAFIADNLSHFKYNYSTILSDEVPLVDVGSIVSLTGNDSFKGISQSVSISASLNSRSIKVVQSFEMKRWDF